MTRWFRFYSEVLNDPKVQKLDGETFKSWVNVMCVASAYDGFLPPVDELAFSLRIEVNACLTLVERLLNATLIDKLSGGPNGWRYALHGWGKRQYKSDTSTERVKRFRKRSETVAETPPETEQNRTDIPLGKPNGAMDDPDKIFWDSAKAYLGKSKAGMIGKWCRDYGKAEAASAITAAQIERAVEPIAYIEKVLRKGKARDDDGEHFTGWA